MCPELPNASGCLDDQVQQQKRPDHLPDVALRSKITNASRSGSVTAFMDLLPTFPPYAELAIGGFESFLLSSVPSPSFCRSISPRPPFPSLSQAITQSKVFYRGHLQAQNDRLYTVHPRASVYYRPRQILERRLTLTPPAATHNPHSTTLIASPANQELHLRSIVYLLC